MKYLDTNKKQAVTNKEVDKFLLELHHLCKKHKMCIGNSNHKKYPLVISTYDKNSVAGMLSNIQLNLKKEKKEEEDEKIRNNKTIK